MVIVVDLSFEIFLNKFFVIVFVDCGFKKFILKCGMKLIGNILDVFCRWNCKVFLLIVMFWFELKFM